MHLSTHVLDTARGRPAEGIAVVFEVAGANDAWVEKARGTTDADGRIKELFSGELSEGRCRLRFATGEYFQRVGEAAFYPEVAITVLLDSRVGRYHLPLLLSPFGYSTYRGS